MNLREKIEHVKTLEGRMSVYNLVSDHLALLIDECVPGGELPTGVTKELARGVLDELSEKVASLGKEIEDLFDEKAEKSSTQKIAKKVPGKKKLVSVKKKKAPAKKKAAASDA